MTPRVDDDTRARILNTDYLQGIQEWMSLFDMEDEPFEGLDFGEPDVPYEVIDGEPDLTPHMLDAIKNSYTNAACVIWYALLYERSRESVERSIEYLIQPFVNRLEEVGFFDGDILFPGCGTGRDMRTLQEVFGYNVFGLDYSRQMLNLLKYFSKVHEELEPPLALMKIEQMAKLLEKNNTFPSQFTGIFFESAAAHVRKSELPDVLNTCADLLVDGGIMLLTLRLTKHGWVYRTEDKAGIRYYTSYTLDEAKAMINASGRWRILEQTTNKHLIEGRPEFGNFILQKIS